MTMQRTRLLLLACCICRLCLAFGPITDICVAPSSKGQPPFSEHTQYVFSYADSEKVGSYDDLDNAPEDWPFKHGIWASKQPLFPWNIIQRNLVRGILLHAIPIHMSSNTKSIAKPRGKFFYLLSAVSSKKSSNQSVHSAVEIELAIEQKVPVDKNEVDERTKAFFTRLEIDQEIRRHHQRKLTKKVNPKFRPQINEKSLKLVNKSGLNFHQRQAQLLENKNNILVQHELQQQQQITSNDVSDANELIFEPQLNEKSRSLVENKRIPRNGAGYSRKNYYYYIAPKEPQPQKRKENEKILKAPNVQKYLSVDVVQRLYTMLKTNAIDKADNDGSTDRDDVNVDDNHEADNEELAHVSHRKLTGEELAEFIKRQKSYEKFRKQKLQRLLKRLQMDEERLTAPSSPGKSPQKKIEQTASSYTELFQSKRQEGAEVNRSQKMSAGKQDKSYSSLSQSASRP